jgi:GNAT superfamily N-acetyltransferase
MGKTLTTRLPLDADVLFRGEFERLARGRFVVEHATAAHAAFLRGLLAETLSESVRRAGGDPALLATGPMLDFQFEAQSRGYATAYPAAHHYVVSTQREGAPIGRMLIDWDPGSDTPVTGIDLAVRPAARAGAAGLHLLRAWIGVCDRLGRAARLHVMPDNPARRIYQWLGFVDTDPTAFPLPMLRTARSVA